MLKTSDEEKSLKSGQKTRLIIYRGATMQMIADFSLLSMGEETRSSQPGTLCQCKYIVKVKWSYFRCTKPERIHHQQTHTTRNLQEKFRPKKNDTTWKYEFTQRNREYRKRKLWLFCLLYVNNSSITFFFKLVFESHSHISGTQ